MHAKTHHADFGKQHETREESRRRKHWFERVSTLASQEYHGQANIVLFKITNA